MRNTAWQMMMTILAWPFVAGGANVMAREIHVTPTGSDDGDGSRQQPLRTINAAAAVAQPGDTVTVHAGTYREWVKPPRGGVSEQERIIYRAAPGEKVVVKGSERITNWRAEGDGVWKVEIPNAFFGDYNPYALTLSGGWLNYGQWHHRGDVYLNGEAFYERQRADEVARSEKTWHCEVGDGVTVIRANFGQADPNRELAEINVRESIFMPAISGLQYITVDGFHFMHAASNWAPPTLKLQTGAVGPRMGKHWVIENCKVTNARCVGIILGHAPGVAYGDIDAFGHHIVRNNIIRRCGQAGIAGQKGATRSLIAGNLIEETNYRREFGGWETAAIKFHNTVDCVIAGNLIRGVHRKIQGAFGIWIDFGNQGIRITRNIIYDTETAPVFLEMDHGPTLVDNNILVGHDVSSNSEATVFAHNLFVDCGYFYHPDVKRRSAYYAPHTTRPVGRKAGTAQDDKWFNNIFIRKGLDNVRPAPGYEADHNIYLEGARKSFFGDQHSLVDGSAAGFAIESRPLGVRVEFSVGADAFTMHPLPVTASRCGLFPTVGQMLEDRDGRPIDVTTDINARPFSPPRPGPLANLVAGVNLVEWRMTR